MLLSIAPREAYGAWHYLEDYRIAQHLEEIEKAQTTLVRIRRDCLTTIAKGSLGQGTIDAVETLVLVDQAIEAAERAKQDEARIALGAESAKVRAVT